ncbi:hypothetical protein BCR44DRAFT_1443619 [Catenaria anguillulae PL171]|uniref:Rad60/SUMO-like domain-containing protein n=1 Tax=Catenaria anguillulae PL171 TaxID=765915 RepID=A0A1Y2H8Z3_9FUNG|nr:hypothetical protein BCR44DRAFT_1443619 [Catenaria anguillulae PL171]
MPITTASDSLVATTADPIKFLLDELNLEGVTRRLEAKYPTLDIQLMVKDYRRFLVLKYEHRDENATHLSPSPLIDQVWHEHVLDTQSYIPMCLAIGLWIHHDPDGASDHDAANRARRRENTVDSYTARFGPMNQDVWDMDGMCRPYLPGRAPPATTRTGLIRLHDEIEEDVEDASDEEADGRAAKRRRAEKRFTIRVESTEGYTSFMQVTESTPFRAIAAAFLNAHGLSVGCWRFYVHDNRIEPDAESSVRELNVEEGDTLEVVKQQGGC